MPLVRKLPGFEKADKKVYRQVVDIRAAFLRKKSTSTVLVLERWAT